MKMAVIGSGPLAILCAHHFHGLGAEVVLFQKKPLGGSLRFIMEHFPHMEIEFQNSLKKAEELWNEYFVPLINSLEVNDLTKAGEVLRVHKRFLHPEETVENRSRIHDLFRVVYSVNPKDAILKQIDENPEMFARLGEQVINSLHIPVESFEDFDLIIECRGLGKPSLPMGPSSAPAINELNLRKAAAIYYGKDIFNQLQFEGKKNILLTGNNPMAMCALIKCSDWLFSNNNCSLTWVYHAEALETKNRWIKDKVEQIIKQASELFEKDKLEYEAKLRQWRDLDDYVRVKTTAPLEPVQKIKIFPGYDVTSIDRLLDQESLFITIESPDFRKAAKVVNDIKTIAADAVMVASGIDADAQFRKGILANEPGYYIINAHDLQEGVQLIYSIENQILAFFSRV